MVVYDLFNTTLRVAYDVEELMKEHISIMLLALVQSLELGLSFRLDGTSSDTLAELDCAPCFRLIAHV